MLSKVLWLLILEYRDVIIFCEYIENISAIC